MFDIVTKFIDETNRLAEAAHKGMLRGLQKAAFAIFRTAQEEIVVDPHKSLPGEPPHSRRGALRRAERYDVDMDAETAVIGPRESVVGTSAAAQEFGGAFKKEHFEARPFMGPALQRNLSLIPDLFSGSVTDN